MRTTIVLTVTATCYSMVATSKITRMMMDGSGDDDDDLHDIDPGLAIPMIQVTKTTLTTMMNLR